MRLSWIKFIKHCRKSPFKVCELKIWVKQPPDVFQNVKTVQQRKLDLNFIRVIKNSSSIRVLYRSIWFNLGRQYLLFHTLSPWVISTCFISTVLVLRSLDMKYFRFANVSIPMEGVTHISNLPTVCLNMMLSSRPTQPVYTLYVKMPNLPKIDVYNFRYKINVGILMKLFFLSHKWINK